MKNPAAKRSGIFIFLIQKSGDRQEQSAGYYGTLLLFSLLSAHPAPAVNQTQFENMNKVSCKILILLENTQIYRIIKQIPRKYQNKYPKKFFQKS